MHMRSSLRSSQGIALVVAMVAVIVVAGIGLLMATRTLNEVRHSRDDARIVQTLLLARGGANLGAASMITDVKAALYPAVFDTSTPGRWTYGNDPSGAGVNANAPDPVSVAEQLALLAARAQTAVDDLLCGVSALGPEAAGTVSIMVFFTDTACGGAANLPEDVTLPNGRYVSGPPRVVTEEGEEVGIQEYALPYVLVSEAIVDDFRRNIVVQGEYVFSVGEAPFSHYAYFTNRESASGGRIYFTDDTLIDGPTHTNGHFSLHKTPWFGGAVTSAGCVFNRDPGTFETNCVNNPETRNPGVYFNSGSNGTFVAEANMSPNSNSPTYGYGNTHAPEFDGGVDWAASYIPLPRNSHNQRYVATGFRPNGSPRDDQGILFTGFVESLTLTVGNALGTQPTRRADGSWSPAATHQYITAVEIVTPAVTREECFIFWCETVIVTPAVTRTVEYRVNEHGLLEKRDAVGLWIAEPKPFNGVIYADEGIERLRGPSRASGATGDRTAPAVASFSMLTVVSPEDIRITSDLRYEQPPCTTPLSKANRHLSSEERCTNLGYNNVLGVFSSDGDVIIGNENGDSSLNAPRNVFIDAVLMSGKHQVRVENYQYGSDKGVVNILGGMIQENRGIFGQVNGNGYDRVYTYDPRMKKGLAPPFFPTTGIGELQEVRVFSFGQREQLY